MTEQSQLVYPPIARAAHIDGMVILLVRFELSGVSAEVKVLSGPPMLQAAAVDFVKSWRANEYTGPRECPIVVSFKFVEAGSIDKEVRSNQQAALSKITRSDLQHVTITTHPVVLYSEETQIKTAKH